MSFPGGTHNVRAGADSASASACIRGSYAKKVRVTGLGAPGPMFAPGNLSARERMVLVVHPGGQSLV